MFSRALRDPRRLHAAFLGVMLLFTAILGGLAWTLFKQDREIQATRVAERRDVAAELVVASLGRSLSGIQQELESWLTVRERPARSAPPRDAVIVRFEPGVLRAWPERALIYNAALTAPVRSDNTAAALLSEAVTQGSQNRLETALASYSRLGAMGAAPVAGMPAALAARLGRIEAYERAHDGASIAEARSLSRDLETGTWPVAFGTYKHLIGQARQRLPATEQRITAAEGLADAVTWLWDRRSREQLDGRWSSYRSPAGSVLLVWLTQDDRTVVFAATTAWLERVILQSAEAAVSDQRVRLSLVGPDGRPVFDGPMDVSPASIRLASDTGLPWTVRVDAMAATEYGTVVRRMTYAASFGVLVAVVLAGSWFIGKAVRRELDVARLKSEFVAAVSHEFRTPLTTLVQLSELLKRGRVATDADRQAYYELLTSESHRLQRLVERLLTFGRIESGGAAYELLPIDLLEVVHGCIEECGVRGQLARHRIDLHAEDNLPPIQADREALASVISNLLENAVKYSPGGGTVWLRVVGIEGRIEVSVRDEGPGIPEEELTRIFELFVRGAAAREAQIRGSGVGLAMARAITRAHGGDVIVRSEAGRGCTFTASFPVARP